MHSGVKESQTNPTNVILFEASGFGERLETHSGENKCNKWDDLLFGAAILKGIWKRTLEESKFAFLGILVSKRV